MPTDSQIKVLISLHKGYGLGDGVQMSAVLRHVAKYRPNWVVDYQAEEGKHQVGRGIIRETFDYDDPKKAEGYDAYVMICLYDTWANWQDRPNTRVSAALHEWFDLPWDRECGRYQVNLSIEARVSARRIFGAIRGERVLAPKVVAVHYKGDSDKARKDLTHDQARKVCEHITGLGGIPLLLDWRDEWERTKHVRVIRDYALQEWGRNAEMNCAIISQCEAFVGIDSGPSKCAGATDTPSLVVWTGHHPAPFYDPAPNVTHLVPAGYHGLAPVCNDSGVIKWFEANHKVRVYHHDPVQWVQEWLTETLGRS